MCNLKFKSNFLRCGHCVHAIGISESTRLCGNGKDRCTYYPIITKTTNSIILKNTDDKNNYNNNFIFGIRGELHD